MVVLMRALAIVFLISSSGCSLLFDGSDLHGSSQNGDGGVTPICGHDAGTPNVAFAMPQGSPTGANTFDVVTADFDKDGNLDIATSNVGGPSISILFGQKGGGFVAPMQLTVSDAHGLAAADFNGDGLIDLATAGSDTTNGSLSIVLNGGNRTFLTPHTLGVDQSGAVQWVAAGDLDGDGKIDVAATNKDTDKLSVFYGDGSGGFTNLQRTPGGRDDHSMCTTSEANGGFCGMGQLGLYALVFADLNKDGKLDAIATAPSNDTIQILMNDGTGNFPPAGAAALMLPSFSSPQLALPVDLTGDGAPELITTDESQKGDVAVFTNNGDGTYSPPSIYDVTGGMGAVKQPFGVVAADLDHDGVADIACANFTSNDVSFLRGHGDGTFDTTAKLFPASPSPAGLAAADLNGDCRLDLVVASDAQAGQLAVLLNQSK